MSEFTTPAEGATHSEQVMIIVNGEQKFVPSEQVNYQEVVNLAYPTPPSPDTIFTVTYRNAEEPNREGSLVSGQSVEAKKKGTIFNVKATTKS